MPVCLAVLAHSPATWHTHPPPGTPTHHLADGGRGSRCCRRHRCRCRTRLARGAAAQTMTMTSRTASSPQVSHQKRGGGCLVGMAIGQFEPELHCLHLTFQQCVLRALSKRTAPPIMQHTLPVRPRGTHAHLSPMTPHPRALCPCLHPLHRLPARVNPARQPRRPLRRLQQRMRPAAALRRLQGGVPPSLLRPGRRARRWV